MRTKILLSAFACDPTKGSELGNGWNWAIGLQKAGYEVHCLTRQKGRIGIEGFEPAPHLKFIYVTLPLGMEKLYGSSNIGMYIYYILWQWFAYRKARLLHRKYKYGLVHHVTWGSLQMGSFMYKLKAPFVFGPAGGGQQAPTAFKKYFLNHWSSEERRARIADLMIKFNPAFKGMLRRAKVVLVSNLESYELAKRSGGKNVELSLDSALSEDFFPKQFSPKVADKGRLKLLWVGRFMPRKGLLLVMDVLNELKEYKGITLTVVGDGEMRDAFLAKIEEYDLHQKVKWVGSVPFKDVTEFYGKHDLFFFTSLRDSGPAQLIEAMAYGLPIVTLNLHGQGMIVGDQTGFRCSIVSPDRAIAELKETLIRLYNEPSQITQMSSSAHEFAIQQRWDKKIERIIDKYYPA